MTKDFFFLYSDLLEKLCVFVDVLLYGIKKVKKMCH